MVDVAKLLSKVPGGADIVKRDGGVVAPPQEAAPVVPPTVSTATPVAASEPVEEVYDFAEDQKTPAPPVEEPAAPTEDLLPTDLVPEDPTDEIDALIDPNSNIKANFHKLRTKLKSTNKEYKQYKQEVEELRTKIQEFETGAATPEAIRKLTDRNAYLEQFEALHNFKGTEVYQEKFIKPLLSEQEKLEEFVKSYPNASIDAVKAAYEAATPAEANRILMQQLKDEVGVLEVKSIFKSMKQIQDEQAKAEKDPAQSMARMQEENDRIIQQRKQEAVKVIKHTSHTGWQESLGRLRNDDRFKEVTFIEGDTEHNEKIVRPMLTKASQAYAQTIATLAKHGLTELPKELATKLAYADTLAVYSGVLLADRERLTAEVAELTKQLETRHRINRPFVNGTVGAGAKPNGASPVKRRPGASALERVGVKMQ